MTRRRAFPSLTSVDTPTGASTPTALDSGAPSAATPPPELRHTACT
ncbi:MAG: hypothetical protein R3F14_17845 [Polyangiaceae bacterium]